MRLRRLLIKGKDGVNIIRKLCLSSFCVVTIACVMLPVALKVCIWLADHGYEPLTCLAAFCTIAFVGAIPAIAGLSIQKNKHVPESMGNMTLEERDEAEAHMKDMEETYQAILRDEATDVFNECADLKLTHNYAHQH
jgi:hypothetical protein